MSDNKALLQKDMAYILKFSNSLDMSDELNLKKVAHLIQNKNPFVSPLGQLYKKRITSLLENKRREVCLFCKKELSQDGIICPSCMNKYSNGKYTINGFINDKPAKKSITKQNFISLDSEKIAANVIDTSKEIAKSAADKVKNINDNHDISDKSKKLLNKMVVLWNKQTKKVKLIISFVAVIIVLALVFGSGSTFSSGDISDKKDAQNIVESVFSEDDGWNIKYTGTNQLSSGSFWGDVGESTKVAEGKANASGDSETIEKYYKTIDCHCFQIQKQDTVNGVQTAMVYVNSEGKINAMGNISGLPDPTTVYRIK